MLNWRLLQNRIPVTPFAGSVAVRRLELEQRRPYAIRGTMKFTRFKSVLIALQTTVSKHLSL